jgi:RHS repeat-associated protein
MVATQTQGTATRSWTLDPAGRLRQATASGTSTRLNHYDDSSDSPAWIDEDTGAATLSATRYVAGLDGDLAAAITHTGTATSARWQLVNLHGDVVSSAADDPALTTPDGPSLDADEFGNPHSATTARYGWLGGKQRSTDALAGLVLMGVRLYDPVLGRFLQVDPVPGGSANAYDYANQDPINNFDLDGRRCWLGHNPDGTCRGHRQWHSTATFVSTHRVASLDGPASAPAHSSPVASSSLPVEASSGPARPCSATGGAGKALLAGLSGVGSVRDLPQAGVVSVISAGIGTRAGIAVG